MPFKKNIITLLSIITWATISSLMFSWYTSWYYIRDGLYYIAIQSAILTALYYTRKKKIIYTIGIYTAMYIFTLSLFIYNFSLLHSVVPIYRTILVLFLFFLTILGIDISLRSYLAWCQQNNKLRLNGGGARALFITVIYALQALLFSAPITISSYYILFGTPITAETFLPLLQTNPLETYEFITSAIPLWYWLYPIVFFTALIYLQKDSITYLGSRITLSIGIISTLLLTILLVSNVQRHILFYKIYKDAQELYNTPLTLYETHREKNLKQVQTQIAQEQGLYIVVIGESVTKLGLGAYGYNRETTPFLSAHLDDPNYILLTNAYAPATFTELSVPYMLTNKSQYNSPSETSILSLLDILQTANIKSIWLSNQSLLDARNQHVRSLALKSSQLIADIGGNISFSQFDSQLLPHIKKVLQSPELKTGMNVLFIHLYGSHINYCRRYDPKLYSIFQNKPVTTNNIDTNSVNCYDNSIYATDALLKEVTALAEQHPHFKMLMYVSDHGEGVYKGKTRAHKEALPDIIKVPLYFYFHDRYIKENKDKITVLRSNANKGYTTDMLYDTLLGIFNIKTNWYNNKQDISNREYMYSYDTIKTLSGTQHVKDILDSENK